MQEYSIFKKLCKYNKVDFTDNKIAGQWFNTFKTKGLDVSVIDKSLLLNCPVIPLEKEQILHFLPQQAKHLVNHLEIVYQTASTNLDIRQSESTQILLAEYQSSGRGRNNRSWISPVGHNIYLSLKFTQFTNNNISFLPVYISLLLAESLTESGLTNLSIKWPNDLYLSGKKFSGSILEFVTSNSGNMLIIGIGINVTMPVYKHPEIEQEYTSICKNGSAILTDRNYLLAKILPSLSTCLESYHVSNIEDYLERIDQFNFLKNKNLLVKEADTSYYAKYSAINSDGSLSVLKDNKIVQLYAADVSVRAKTND